MPSATEYFARICNLLQQTRVTDAGQKPLLFNDAASQGAQAMLDTGRRGNKVILLGNGGSASIAGHMQMDLCNRAHVPALVFNNPPVLTALANDHGYVTAFERLVTLHGEPGDLVIAISSSGQSENLLRAADAARAAGCSIITFTGFKADNPLRQLGDLNYYIDSTHYGEVEVAHHALGHFLTDCAVDDVDATRQAIGKRKPIINVNGQRVPAQSPSISSTP